MGKYADHCVRLFVKQNNPPEPGRSDVFMFGQEHFQASPFWVEIWTVTGKTMLMQGTPKGTEQIFHFGADGHRGGPYPKYHHNADNIMVFAGTDPRNMKDLGAHVEFHVGEGDEEKIFEFDEPRTIFIPKGVRHGPLYVTNFRRNFTIFDLLTAPTRKAAGTDNDFSYVADEEKLRLVSS
jgi:hypothetical protein